MRELFRPKNKRLKTNPIYHNGPKVPNVEEVKTLVITLCPLARFSETGTTKA
jgi:hypothetical protein